MVKFITTLFLIGIIVSCSNTPNVTVNYYPTAWTTDVIVTQTVVCNTSDNRLLVANTPSVTTTYASDLDKIYKITIKDLDGTFADIDIAFAFTDDGRLKSINQSSTGQGETIVKSSVALATTLKMLPIVAGMTFMEKMKPIEACEILKDWSEGKPVTLFYKATIDSNSLGKTIPFEASFDSRNLYQKIHKSLPILSVEVSKATDSKCGPSYQTESETASSDEVFLELQKIGSTDVTIKADAGTLDSFRIVIPLTDTYKLPIPKAAVFGKQSFALTLSDAGAVTNIGYGKTVGTAGAINALSAIANTQTTTTKTAELKAQADLIAQQQRLVRCLARPDECGK